MIYIITILMTTLFSSSLFSQTNCQDARQKYWILYQDVANAKHDPFDHYQVYGKNEGRVWPACKGEEEDCENARSQYYKLYPDVYKAGANAWTHYQTFGINEGRVWPYCNKISKNNVGVKSINNDKRMKIGRVLSDTNVTSSIKESKNFIEIRLTIWPGLGPSETYMLTFNRKWKLEYVSFERMGLPEELGKGANLYSLFKSLVKLDLFTLLFVDDNCKRTASEYIIDFEKQVCEPMPGRGHVIVLDGGHIDIEYKIDQLFRQYSDSYCGCEYCATYNSKISKITGLFLRYLNP